MKKKFKIAAVSEQPSMAPQAAPVAPAPEAPAPAPVRTRKDVEQEYNNILFDIGGKHLAISRTQQVIKQLEEKCNALLIEIQMIDLKANLKAAQAPQEAK